MLCINEETEQCNILSLKTTGNSEAHTEYYFHYQWIKTFLDGNATLSVVNNKRKWTSQSSSMNGFRDVLFQWYRELQLHITLQANLDSRKHPIQIRRREEVLFPSSFLLYLQCSTFIISVYYYTFSQHNDRAGEIGSV